MTITDDLVQEVFNKTIFPNLKGFVEKQSLYNPKVVKSKPSVSKIFPIVPIKLLPSQNTYGNLSYTQERFSFGIEIDVNSQDKVVEDKVISRRTICEEITNLVIKYFKENFRVSIYVEPNAVSTDDTVHRALIRISGVIDTRYGKDNLVIYPR